MIRSFEMVLKIFPHFHNLLRLLLTSNHSLSLESKFSALLNHIIRSGCWFVKSCIRCASLSFEKKNNPIANNSIFEHNPLSLWDFHAFQCVDATCRTWLWNVPLIDHRCYRKSPIRRHFTLTRWSCLYSAEFSSMTAKSRVIFSLKMILKR